MVVDEPRWLIIQQMEKAPESEYCEACPKQGLEEAWTKYLLGAYATDPNCPGPMEIITRAQMDTSYVERKSSVTNMVVLVCGKEITDEMREQAVRMEEWVDEMHIESELRALKMQQEDQDAEEQEEGF